MNRGSDIDCIVSGCDIDASMRPRFMNRGSTGINERVSTLKELQ